MQPPGADERTAHLAAAAAAAPRAGPVLPGGRRWSWPCLLIGAQRDSKAKRRGPQDATVRRPGVASRTSATICFLYPL